MSLALRYTGTDQPDRAQLEGLAARALEPNIFFEPALLQAALENLAPAHLKLCTSHDAETGDLTGAAPVVRAKGRYGPLSIVPAPLMVWQHPYAMVGSPLIHRTASEVALATLLETIQEQFRGPNVLLMRHVPADGPFWPLLKMTLAHTDRRHVVLETYDRAGLDVTDPSQTTLRKLIGKKSASSIRSSRRKLGELGTVKHQSATDGAALARALETFLTLEASGWKGRAGTALLTSGEGHAAFIRDSIRDLAKSDRSRVDIILLNSEPIAGTVSIRAGTQSVPNWMPWKTAYDERFIDYGPGSLSLHDLTEILLHEAMQNNTPLMLDSLAVSDSVIANRLWRHRWTFMDVLVDLSPTGSAAFGPIHMAERARMVARQVAQKATKRARNQLKSRGQEQQS